MLCKRIIPCLDVRDGRVVKGIKFKNHIDMGDVTELAQFYSDEGADELVFYDITASTEDRSVDFDWVTKVASLINIPFCVAGGINSIKKASEILGRGADKVSINTPAIENPSLIANLSQEFGAQCVVVGIDSFEQNGSYKVKSHTGKEETLRETNLQTIDWVNRVIELGAGEIVLNCMNQDGVRKGYDLEQLRQVREICQVPLIASGGAGEPAHFSAVFKDAQVDGALAASVFHSKNIRIPDLRGYLKNDGVNVREVYESF